jgi:DinB superfamily
LTPEVERTVALISRTPSALNALLRGLPDEWTLHNEGAGTWNVPEVIGHLIEGDRANWIPRIRIIVEFGESRPFEPFDRTPLEGSLAELLDRFAELRGESVAALRDFDLQPEDMAKTGIHPVYGRVTMRQLISTWAVHDLTHLNQISRVMARQSLEAVGPWVEYLGVLRRSVV